MADLEKPRTSYRRAMQPDSKAEKGDSSSVKQGII